MRRVELGWSAVAAVALAVAVAEVALTDAHSFSSSVASAPFPPPSCASDERRDSSCCCCCCCFVTGTERLLKGFSPWSGTRWRPRERSQQQRSLRLAPFAARGGGEPLLSIVQRKEYEVEQLLKGMENTDPLKLRLGYSNSESSFRLRNSLRRNKGLQDHHQIAVIPDLKRQSPTAPPHRIVNIDSMGSSASQMRDVGVDALMVNVDFPAYGGDIDELEQVVKAVAYSSEDPGPPVIMKDVIVHPIQLAVAAEKGAAGAVLMATVLGPRLEDLMDTATIMGFEVMVEVHSTAECSKALEYGANCILVNQWDRITGKLYPRLAENMRRMIPNEVITVATGGISGVEEVSKLADEGFDAVVLGRSLLLSTDPAAFVRESRSRMGLQRQFLGMGIRADDIM